MPSNPGPSDDVAAALPLSWVDFHVLLALADAPLHGYGIMQDAEERTDGSVVLEPGNLYRALRRLTDRGIVARAEPPDGADDDPRRRYYALTVFGRRVAAAETQRMAALVRTSEERALADGPGR